MYILQTVNINNHRAKYGKTSNIELSVIAIDEQDFTATD